LEILIIFVLILHGVTLEDTTAVRGDKIKYTKSFCWSKRKSH